MVLDMSCSAVEIYSSDCHRVSKLLFLIRASSGCFHLVLVSRDIIYRLRLVLFLNKSSYYDITSEMRNKENVLDEYIAALNHICFVRKMHLTH